LGRVRNVIGAAHDVGNAHVDVIGHDAQVVSGMTVRAEENEIFNFLVFELEVAEDLIVKTGLTGGRDTKPECEWTVCTSPLLPLMLRKIATNAVISPGPLLRFRLCALGLQFFWQ